MTDAPAVAETPTNLITDEQIKAAIDEEKVVMFVNRHLPNVLSREQVLALQEKGNAQKRRLVLVANLEVRRPPLL
eukprot:1513524-Pleurochrysis_carterae.AAC.1